jgi:cytochrome bd ubiquinol oxidase subunit II
MVLQAIPMVFVLTGLALYTVLAGADFGAGFWQLLAGSGPRGERLREYAHHAMGPVWEANHVWLIFVLTVFWTSYPTAFGSIMSTLAIPLFIALGGIVFRGAAYALRPGASSSREAGVVDTIFAGSSIIAPFALGCCAGAIATGRVPVGNAAGGLVSSWLNASSVTVGVLAVVSSAYVAAVFLAADAAREQKREIEGELRLRALGAGVVGGFVAIGAIFVLDADSHALYRSLVSGKALPAVIVSVLAGATTLWLVWTRRFEPARYVAALAVAATIAGWALARWPTILPGLTVDEAAAGHDTLVWVVVSVLAGAVVLFPSLGLLFGLTLKGRFGAPAREESAGAGAERRAPLHTRLGARAALAMLIAGFGLLNVADAGWAHAVGVVCLFGCVVTAFRLIAFEMLGVGACEGGNTVQQLPQTRR